MLHWAADAGSVSLVRHLLLKGIQADSQNDDVCYFQNGFTF